MAVTGFKLAPHEHRAIAGVMREVGLERAAKELERAAVRPGRRAELTQQEFEAMDALGLAWPANVAATLDTARDALRVAAASEATRLRGPALGAAPHRSFNARQEAKLKRKDRSRPKEAKREDLQTHTGADDRDDVGHPGNRQ
jgi:hypothetical protein